MIVTSPTQARPKPPPTAPPSTSMITTCGLPLSLIMNIAEDAVAAGDLAGVAAALHAGAEALDVAAGAEDAALAADYERADRAVVADGVEHVRKLGHDLAGERIARVGAVEPDAERALLLLQDQGICRRQVGHPFLPITGGPRRNCWA